MDSVLEILDSYHVLTLIGLILLDVVLGIAKALKTGNFQWSKTADFYQTSVLPYVLGFIVVKVVLDNFINIDVIGNAGEWLNPALVNLTFSTLVFKIVSSIKDNFNDIYFPIRANKLLGKNEHVE